MEILNAGVQAEEFLSAFSPLESLLLSFLTPCETVGLLDHVVAASGRDHLLMVDVDEARDLPNRGPVTPQLIGTDRVWNIIFAKQLDQKGSCRLGITVSLEQDVEHAAVLVYCSPKPMANTVDSRADLVQKPPGTPPGFPVTQFLDHERSEFHAPFAQGLMADHNAALVQQFLNVPVTEWETVVQPNGMLDDGYGKAVAVGLDVGHCGSAYPELLKATQSEKGMTYVDLARVTGTTSPTITRAFEETGSRGGLVSQLWVDILKALDLELTAQPNRPIDQNS